MLETQSVSETVSNVLEIWQYLGQNFGISWAYLGYILGLSWAYLGYIMGISLRYLGHHLAHLVFHFCRNLPRKRKMYRITRKMSAQFCFLMASRQKSYSEVFLIAFYCGRRGSDWQTGWWSQEPVFLRSSIMEQNRPCFNLLIALYLLRWIYNISPFYTRSPNLDFYFVFFGCQNWNFEVQNWNIHIFPFDVPFLFDFNFPYKCFLSLLLLALFLSSG